MSISTNLVAGLSSGFDWRSMIDQLLTVEHRPVDLVTAKEDGHGNKTRRVSGRQFQLLAFKTAAAALKGPRLFFRSFFNHVHKQQYR